MNNYKPKYYNYHKYTNEKMHDFGIPEHSNKLFKDSFTAITKASGITDLEMCRHLRCSNTTIGNYRKGKFKYPTKEFMQKIADFFDIKPSYFWEYRKIKLDEFLEKNPELLDVFLDISTTPRRVLDEYRQAKALSYQDNIMITNKHN